MIIVVKSDCLRLLNEIKVNLVSQQLTNVRALRPDHGRSLKRQSPSENTHVLRQSHSLQHLRSEHSRVTDLDKLVEALVERENLERRLGIWVICWLETQIVDTHLVEEDSHELHKSSQSQIIIRNNTLDLVELSQMCRIHSLVSENTVNGEITCWWWTSIWALHLCELVKHVCGDSGGVCAENESQGLISSPWVSVTNRSVLSLLMNLLHVLPVRLIITLIIWRIRPWLIRNLGI